MLLILLVGVSCLFICLQFFAAVVVDVLIKESCVEWNNFKQEKKVCSTVQCFRFFKFKIASSKGQKSFPKQGMINFLFTFRSNLVWIGVKADKSGFFSPKSFLVK